MLKYFKKYLLSFGLDFALPVLNLNFNRFFLSVEKLVRVFEQQPIFPRFTREEFRKQIQSTAYRYFYSTRLDQSPLPIFNKEDIDILKKLKKQDNFIILKPDKSRGVVLINREDYNCKLETILRDPTKFRKLQHDGPFKKSLSIKDKINGTLLQLKGRIYSKDW